MSIQYLYGDSKPISVPVLSGQAVSVGDLSALSSGNIVRAQDLTYTGAVSTPSAPTVTNGAVNVGSSLTNSLTNVKISYQFPWGEGALSPAGNATPTAGALLIVSGSPLVTPAPALWTNVYVETSAGSGVYKLWGTTTGASVLVGTYGNGAAPTGSAVTSGNTDVTQWTLAQNFIGVSGQTKLSTKTLAYGNSLATIRVATDGVFLVDLASSSTLAVGALLGAAPNSGPTALQSQVCQSVVQEQLAVFRVVEAVTSALQVKAQPICRLASDGIVTAL